MRTKDGRVVVALLCRFCQRRLIGRVAQDHRGGCPSREELYGKPVDPATDLARRAGCRAEE